MAMIHIVTYWWGDKYPPHYVERLRGMLKRNLRQPHRFIIVTDKTRPVPPDTELAFIPEEDLKLLEIRGCFARLRLFDQAFQHSLGIKPGDIVTSMDLDVVITAAIDPLFDWSGAWPKEAGLRIVQDINTANPCKFNGSLWTFFAGGQHAHVWCDFSVDNYKAFAVPFYEFPDDQGWLEHKFPNALAYGKNDGVFAFKKKHWPPGDGEPLGCRFVCFPGWRDPSRFVDSVPWIKKHWRA